MIQTHDICIRLGKHKPLKQDLEKIAKKNSISLNRLMIFVVEHFVKEHKNFKIGV
jgi:hypothetical protein